MFLNITEDDIRMNCPEAAPMTLRAYNKLIPRQFNSKVSVLNPYEIPRYAPTSSTQFAKSLLQQTPAASSQDVVVNDVQVTELAKELTKTAKPENYVGNVGKDEDPGVGGLALSSASYAVALGIVGANKAAAGVGEAVTQLGQGSRDVDKAADDAYDAGADVLMGFVGRIEKEIKTNFLKEDKQRMVGDFKKDDVGSSGVLRPMPRQTIFEDPVSVADIEDFEKN